MAISLLLGQAFCMGLALYAFYVAANALFLAEFGAQMIPYVYIAAAALIASMGVIWSRMQARVSFNALLTGTLGLLMATVLALRLGLTLTSAAWLVFAVMVWLRLLWVMGNLVLFALAGRLFSVRQGKRLFPLISAAAVLAIILAGLTTSPLIALVGTANLLLVSGVALAIALVLLVITLAKLRDQLASAEPAPVATTGPARRRWTSLIKTPFVALIVIYTIMSTLGTYVLDFAFVSEAATNYAEADDLARFFGSYIGLSTLTNLLFLALIAGRILSRFGVKGGVLANPLLVGAGAVVVAGATLISAPAGLIFGLVVMTKLFDEVMTTAMTNTSVRVLYQPLAADQRLSIQGAVEGIVGPLALGASGVLLLLLMAAGNISLMQTISLLLVVLSGWIMAAVLLGRSYPDALRRALSKRTLGGGSLSLDDGSSIAVLEQRLQSPRPGDLLFALEMLDQADYVSLNEVLTGLLDHPAAAVRQVSLEKIGSRGFVSAFPAVAERLKVENDPAIRAAAVSTLCTLGGPATVEQVAPCLTDPEAQVRLAAMSGLFASGDSAVIRMIAGQLSELEKSPNPEDRAFAARAFGDSGGERSIQPLMKLIGDEDPKVYKAALLAAGKVNNPQLWPLIVEALGDASRRAMARQALEAGGRSVLPFIGRALVQPAHNQEVLLALYDLCGKIKGEEASQLLKNGLERHDRQVDGHVLQALNACGYRADTSERPALEQAIGTEIKGFTRTLNISEMLKDQDNDSLAPLLAALKLEMERTRSRVLLRLSFLFDAGTILNAGRALQSGLKDQIAYAIEALDVLLPRNLKGAVMPLFAPMSDRERLQQLGKQHPQEPAPLESHLAAIVEQKALWSSAWPRACALYAIAGMPDPILEQVIKTGLVDPDPLVRETAVWALSRRPSAAYSERLEVLRNETNAGVARLARQMASEDRPQQGDLKMLLTIEKVLVLKSVNIFSSTAEDTLVDVAAVLEEVEVTAGEAIFKKGDLGDSLYIIVEGRVRVHDGDRTLNTLGAREVFGEMAVLDAAPRVASVTAIEDAVLLRLDQAPFYELMENRIEIVRGILQVLTGYVRDRVQDVTALEAQLQHRQA